MPIVHIEWFPGSASRPLFLLLLATILVFAPFSVQAARDAASQRECATCHVMWLKDFKRTDVATVIPYEPKPVVDTGRQDAASTERMCFSCHDGFVRDSRERWKNPEHSHPVGVKPSSKVRIPTKDGKKIFPLNEDGKVYCGTCHSAHGVKWGNKLSPVFLREENVDSSLCFACHLEKGTGPEEGNHPVFEKPGTLPSKLIKAGAKFSKKGEVICQSCHRVHGSGSKKLLVLNNSKAQMCQTCHENKKSINNTKHDIALMAPKSKNIHGHTPAQSGSCAACHTPHGAVAPSLWARPLAKGEDPITATCLGCHSEKGLADKKTLGKHTHPVKIDITRAGIEAKMKKWVSSLALPGSLQKLIPLPLYTRQGMRSDKGGRIGCGSCHDPHVWSAGGTKPKGHPEDTEGGPLNSFLRIPYDNNASLCINCHVNKSPVLLSEHNLSISGPKTKNKQGKTVAEGGVCSACHLVHHGESTRIWARKDVDKNQKGVASLCASCHRDGGVAADKQPGVYSHPVQVKYKGKMTTKLPLYANGHDGQGVLDCSTCHDPHQWKPGDPTSKQGAKAGIEGLPHNSFLRIPYDKNARLCVNCHTNKKNVIKTEHDLSVTAPHSKNILGQQANETGVCNSCHLVHQAGRKEGLWAREPGKGRDHHTQVCLSCHDEKKLAKNKQVKNRYHPQEARIWAPEVYTQFRARNKSGIEMFHNNKEIDQGLGLITCVSCHDPHQWRPDKNIPGPGKNTEGTVMNSFLRTSNTEAIVCRECHGLDSLFRYKYFHGKASTK